MTPSYCSIPTMAWMHPLPLGDPTFPPNVSYWRKPLDMAEPLSRQTGSGPVCIHPRLQQPLLQKRGGAEVLALRRLL
jgi:hypothetical protein